MEFFDIRKMPISLWRNGAGETREICCFPPATREFNWRASIASLASNGDFSVSPGVDRVITLLEGGRSIWMAERRLLTRCSVISPSALPGTCR